MENLFKALSKPAKFVLIIGGLIYAVWFAIQTAMGIQSNFMSVLTGIITLIVGVGLLAIPPVMLLIKKDDIAKLFFVFLIGYWVLTTPQEYFFLADTFSEANEFFPVFVSIFLLIIGIAVLSILVLLVLEILFGMKFLRPIINLVAFISVCACIFTAILFIIEAAIMGAGWTFFVQYAFMDMILLPTVVGFGCLYFFGAQGKKAE